MNAFEMVVLIVGIVMIARVATAKYRATGDDNAAETARLGEEIRALKDRVAVLERLATDDSTRLAREIEQLRDRP